MKLAADFRKDARDALRGKWPIAILVGLVAAILGGAGAGGPEFKFNFDTTSGFGTTFSFAGQTLYSTGYGFDPRWHGLLIGGAIYLTILVLVLAAAYYILGSFVGVGYAKYNLGLVDRTEPGFETLFAYVSHWRATAFTRLQKGLYIFLWSLLLVVPGIMKAYSYAMTDYILAEQPELPAGEVLARSKAMMDGNRWRLFCLQFSFIGWSLLCALTFGIGDLALRPYREAASAAFYRELCGGAAAETESEGAY